MAAFRRDVEQAVAANVGAGSTVQLVAVTNSSVYRGGALVLTVNITFPTGYSIQDGYSLAYYMKQTSPSDLSVLLSNMFAQKWKMARVMCVVVLDGVDTLDRCSVPRRFIWWPYALAGGIAALGLLCVCCILMAVLWKRKRVRSVVVINASFKPFEEDRTMHDQLSSAARDALVQTLGNGLRYNMVEVEEVRRANPDVYPDATEIVFVVNRPWNLRRLVSKHQSFELVYKDRFTPPNMAHVVLGDGFVHLSSWAAGALASQISVAVDRWRSGTGFITKHQTRGAQPVAEGWTADEGASPADTADVAAAALATGGSSSSTVVPSRSTASLPVDGMRRRTSRGTNIL